MADASDLVRAWRDVTQQIRSLAGSVAGQVPQGLDVLGPLQRQADLIEQLIRRQVDLEQDLVRRALAPAEATMSALESAPESMRAQATAFRAAATAFNQAADLLDLQAGALEQTLAAFKAPAQLASRTLRGRRPKADV